MFNLSCNLCYLVPRLAMLFLTFGLSLRFTNPVGAQGLTPQCTTPPSQIYVNRMYNRDNLEDPQFVLVDFEDNYVVGVLEGEMAPTARYCRVVRWHSNALKAGAIAARNWGAYWCHKWTFDNTPFGTIQGVYDSANEGDQEYHPGHSGDTARYQQVVADTRGVYMTYNDTLIDAEYRAENGEYTNPEPGDCPGIPGGWPEPYLKGVHDPISTGATRSQAACNSVGLGQCGAQRWATGNFLTDGDDSTAYSVMWVDELQILAHYYTAVEFQGRDTEQWYRWNCLYNGAPVWMYPGQTTNMQVQMQNTGQAHWLVAGAGVPDLCYRWHDKVANYAPITNWACTSMTTALNDLAPGADREVVIALTVPTIASGGNYLLELDLAMEGHWLFSDHGWVAQPKWIAIGTETPADTTPPHNPSVINSTSGHVVGTWYGNNQVSLTWAGATDDSSGIRGYAYLWSEAADSLPPAEITSDAGVSSFTAQLPDGPSWYFHIRTEDNARNWTPIAAHLGPFRIDATPPANPTILQSTSHTTNNWSTDNTVDVAWFGATDTTRGSGVRGYSYAWTTGAVDIPDDIEDTSGSGAALADGNRWYFHIRTVDGVGNWNANAAHVGPFMIDTAPPVAAITALRQPANKSWCYVDWAAEADLSGIAYSEIQYQRAGGVWQTWIMVSQEQSYTRLFTRGRNDFGTEYCFRARAIDNAGNAADFPIGAEQCITTGTDASGLADVYLPVALKNF